MSTQFLRAYLEHWDEPGGSTRYVVETSEGEVVYGWEELTAGRDMLGNPQATVTFEIPIMPRIRKRTS